MKKFLFGLVGLIFVLAAAVFIVPGLIDWNDYKDQIAARAEALTGRSLAIDGDIRVTLLPAPALVVNEVGLANIAGAAAPEMVRLKSLEIRVALGPLLGGQVQVETVKLVEPTIALEVLGDGRRNWDFRARPAPAPGAGTPAAGASPPAVAAGVKPSVQLDSFTIENGTLVYRDARDGTVERVTGINARLAAQSLSGPFESSGRLVARGIPLNYDMTLGKIIEQRTVSLNLMLTGVPGGTKVEIAGTLLNLAKAPRFKGKVKGGGDKLADLIATAGAGGPLPGFLTQEFGFEGAVAASGAGAEIKDLALRLGQTKATGEVSVKLGKTTSVAVQIALNHIDMDKWLALSTAGGVRALAGRIGTGSIGAGSIGTGTSVPLKPAAGGDEGRAPGFSLPTGIDASLNLSVGAITYKGRITGEVRASAELANGEITLSQLSAQLPGGADVAVFGFLTADGGKPRFEGEVEASVSDFRGVLAWLGQEAPDVPADRLRRFTLASKFTATPRRIDATGLDFQFDSSRLTGALSVALRERPAFDANVTLDRVNLDAYLPPSAPAAPKTKPEAGADSGGTPAPAPGASAPRAPDLLTPMRALGGFDADIKARVKTVVYRGTSIKDVVFDGALSGNALEVRRASVAKLAGASATIRGTLRGLSGMPEMEGVRFDVRTPDPSRLFRLLGVDSPVPPAKLGKVALSGRADGSPLRPAIDVTVNAAGAEIGLAGAVSLLPPAPTFDLTLTAKHGDLARLVRVFGADYRPRKRLGGLDIVATAKGDAATLTLSDIKGKVGPVPVQGAVTLALGGPRPRITADLKTGEIVVDRFLPAKRTAWLPGGVGVPRLVPASWVAPRRPAAGPAIVRVAAARAPGGHRWSREPIDLSALRRVDAGVKLKATAIVFAQYRLENADLAATVSAGVLTAERLGGVVFGGALQANGRVEALSPPRMQTVLSLRNVDIASAGRAVAGKDAASGRMDLDLRLATSGRNVADMVQGLGGTGSLAMRGLKVKGDAKGTALAAALNLVAGLNRLGGALGGQKRGKGLADISGTFKIDRGVARSEDMRLVSNLGNGQARGSVDLPNWRIDVDGEMQLSENVLTALLSRAAKAKQTAKVVPFRIRGPLDAPNVKIDMANLQGVRVPLPGVGKLLKKKLLKKKGIGKVLQGVLGVPPAGQPQGQPPPPPLEAPPPGQAPASAAPSPPAPPPTEEKKKIRPADLLKQLFKIR